MILDFAVRPMPVYTLTRIEALPAALRFAVRALFGRLAQARDFDVVLVENMEIETRHKHLRVATDGEVGPLGSRFVFRSRTNALAIYRPRDPA
mgnify:CR=1 FL=1